MKQGCNKNYLRLSELAKECGEGNYFSKLLEKLHSPYMFVGEIRYIKETERQLCCLDDKAWEAFKSKVKNYATRRAPLSRYSQVIDVLNEVKGYIYLKDQGYTSVEFVPEGNGEKPDLHATGEIGEAFMEVKTIHMSDDEVKMLVNLNAPAKDVEEGIPEGLKKKLKDTVKKAKAQLSGKTGRRICYLFIKLDIGVWLDPQNYEALDKYLKTLQGKTPEIEIKCEYNPRWDRS